jgi:hypothetical protein
VHNGSVLRASSRPWLLGVGVTLLAGAAGWALAGPPGDATAVTPPSCPPSFARGVADAVTAGDPVADRPGLIDGLVPAGPVSARICGYSSVAGAAGPARSRVLDPTWTAELAALLDARALDRMGSGVPGQGRVVDASERARCAPGPAPALLLFRYRQGPALTVALGGGGCAAAWTPARSELDRADVHERVGELLS